jgi:hypothetical protein
MLLLDAVRVARNYDRAVPRVYCIVTKDAHGEWSVKVTKDRVVDPIEVCLCETMRTSPPTRWGEVYAGATERAGSVADGARVHARGVEFWRVYYGVPDMSVADLLAAHTADTPRWDPQLVIASRRTQEAALEYRTRVRATVCRAIDGLETYLRKTGHRLDARLVHSAFSLVRRTVDAVLVAKRGGPLSGAMYPTYVLETTMADGPLARTVRSAAARARGAGEHLLEHNTRVLVVKHIEDDEGKLEALLAHEIAHAITVPIWQPNNNHPPAFVEFETLTSHALAGTLVSHGPDKTDARKTDVRRTDAKNEAKNNEAKKTDVRRTDAKNEAKNEAKKKDGLTAGPSAPSLPRSKPPRVSSSLRAGTRRSQ